ncbi:hypothetical protein [Sphaerospermopsis sp. FACHB-1194]|uniref:hypothetical protein n=1 Tax=Sphaerospermopsis sp. FACHB-1194 TaxID=2692862 RepID=UPI001681991D|nr:hypothetical protein [Sphaerospermopsis sp. FACHB-1194]MBD2144051.1 hypothetical protein [Sphaerospermopsis sp. FACHB-1194]
MNIGKRQESGVRSQESEGQYFFPISPCPHLLISPVTSHQSPVPSHQSPVPCLLTRQKQQTPAIFAGVSQ